MLAKCLELYDLFDLGTPNSRHVDKKQRFITYYELVDYLSGNDQLVVEAATAGPPSMDMDVEPGT